MSVDSLNGVCPYYTMYPLSFPLNVLKRHGRPGEIVLDPFCGRGTTNFAARLLRMPSYGIDSSPVAHALTRAKLVYASPRQVLASARAILCRRGEPSRVPSGEFWQLAYHPDTLAALCRLRDALASARSPARILLRAIILGALHGPRPKGKPSYFSNQSPRTFAPKPGYAVRFWRQRKLLPEKVDILEIIGRRSQRYLAERPPDVAGAMFLDDSRRPEVFAAIPSPAWVITSPPYYGMRTYLPDQWLRLWFLGGPDHVEYRQTATQLTHTGATHFAEQMATVWRNVQGRILAGGNRDPQPGQNTGSLAPTQPPLSV